MSSFLMCPPTFFDVSYSINPWMKPGARVDHGLAEAQWSALRQQLVDAGASVEVIDPVEGLPDMVFAANYGLVDGRRFVAASYRHPERQPEVAPAVAWFRARGYECTTVDASPGVHFEGGEVFTCAGHTWVGFGMRNNESGVTSLERQIARAITPLRLIDPAFYHLDTCFCPLTENAALVALDAFDPPSRNLINRLIPEVISMEREEAMSLAANSVVLDHKILMPGCSPRIVRVLEALGYEPIVIDVSEFVKAGGAIRCMVLPIDTAFRSRSGNKVTEPAGQGRV